MFDCIIVGAGPAGGTAAYHLAKRGCSVLLLEKSSLPRYKPCGGGVSSAVQEWFDFDLTPAISLKVNSVCYTWNQGDPVEVNLEVPPIWMVRREVFDYFLVKQAIAQGAQLRDKTAVTGIEWQGVYWQVNTADEPVTGRYAIAADGAKGPMAKWLGFSQRKSTMGSALEAEIPTEQQELTSAYFELGAIKKGYGWNFPKTDGYSIGVGRFWRKSPEKFKHKLVEYANIFNVDGINKPYGHPIYLWNGNQKIHAQNAVLAGEAACVVDPFTAEGIRPSIFSGMRAAHAIAEAIAGDINALEKYTTTMKEEWGAEMIWPQRIAQAFYNFPSIGYKAGIKQKSNTITMTKIFAGERRYSDAAKSALKRLMG
ncbi:MAG: geranylgeranyl reductase family protein [Hormoscilla sp. GM102CHS1]|nr:geranylgeranyl reductase family protein [Hormoscilla sp. GM102CHS1]